MILYGVGVSWIFGNGILGFAENVSRIDGSFLCVILLIINYHKSQKRRIRREIHGASALRGGAYYISK